jgi:Family of unknown function (DUF5335)
MHAETKDLKGRHWADYFGSIACQNGGVLATVEVLCEPLPLQANGNRRRPLREARYDLDADVLELLIGGSQATERSVRYFISAPRTVSVAEWEGGRAIVVQDASGARTLIRLFNANAAQSAAMRSSSRGLTPASHNGSTPRL